MKPYALTLMAALLMSGLAGRLAAQEGASEPEPERASGPVIELESQVTGNREQPQVIHVVPWQTPDSPVPDYDPLERQLETVFGHIERDELQRRLPAPDEKTSVPE